MRILKQMQICTGILQEGYGGEEKMKWICCISLRDSIESKESMYNKKVCREAALNKLTELSKSKSLFQLLERNLGQVLSHDWQTQVKSWINEAMHLVFRECQ